MTRLVIDPVTRIEGHLRIEAELDNLNAITQAYSSGTMVRGLEIILKGRDPREAWAFVQRACGVCTTVHAIASVRAVENALSITIPPNANLIRNLMLGQQYVHDHVMHFYHLHALDWVDVVSALSADPTETARIQQAISPWRNASPGYFATVKSRVQAIVDSGQLNLFANGYWGHPAMALPPEINLLATAHYLEALDWQKDVIKVHTIFGGKNPHPNFLVGGVPVPIDPNDATALNVERLTLVAQIIDKLVEFVDQVYIPDVLAVAPYYLEYAGVGEGLGNFLSCGEFPLDTTDPEGSLWMPRGVILDRDLSTVHEYSPADVEEYVVRSWYEYTDGNDVGLHPWKGETKFNYTGPQPPYEELNVEGKYTWLKAPRLNGRPMEVGPLARVLVMYASGNEGAVDAVDGVLAALSKAAGTEISATVLFSTLGRTAARAIETQLIAHELKNWYDALVANIGSGDLVNANVEKWEPESWPSQAQGVGCIEAPRGALGHWIVIENEAISNYQLVVPTTWNASPRDSTGQPGAYEMALVGTKLVDPELPLEMLRTIHSFDPCMACAIHLIDAAGREVTDVDATPGPFKSFRIAK